MDSVTDFAARIKSKYPDYAGMDDRELVNRIVTKHPEYKDQVDLGGSAPAPGAAPAAPSAPTAMPKIEGSPIFPTAAAIQGDGPLQSVKRIGAGVSDLLNVPTRAAATLTGQSMSDPNAYLLRPAVEALKVDPNGHRPSSDIPAGIPVPDSFSADPGAVNANVQAIGQFLSDPLVMLGKGAQLAGKVGGRAVEALHGLVPGLKNYVSGLSQIKGPLLEKAATAEGMATLKDGAQMKPEELAQQIAGDAGAINKQRADFQGPLQANSKATQQNQAAENILEARRLATGAPEASLSDIKPGALGEDIKSAVLGSKADMQDAWLKGDQNSVGPLRSAPAPNITVGEGKGARVQMKLLTRRIGDVLDKYKAFDPSEGMRKISEGAAGALQDIMGHAEKSGHTVDDLLNIKAELRRVSNMDKYKGIPFDASTDDVAFGDANREISSVIDVALHDAAPKQAADISDLMRAKDRQYAISKDLLGDQARSLNQTQNSANIIQKVKQMGPENARELIAGAESNPAIASLVPKLRQGFVDDLILSSMKDGDFSAQKMSTLWNDSRLQESKAAWLALEDIKRIDGALDLGTMEIGKPPLPDKVGRQFSYQGEPNADVAKARIGNIGHERPVDQMALKDLQVLDQINGTNHADQAMKIFESGKLGMNPEGQLSAHPMQTTGARGFATQKGQVFGRVIGGAGGTILGAIAASGYGAAAGGVAGERLANLAGDIFAAVHSNLGSPAGAVAAYQKLNDILAIKFPRAAAIADAMGKTSDAAQKARLGVLLKDELTKADAQDSASSATSPKRAPQPSAGIGPLTLQPSGAAGNPFNRLGGTP